MCTRDNMWGYCSQWGEEQWPRFETIKKRPKTEKDSSGAKLADMKGNFAQIANYFNSHRISTDETLNTPKQDYKAILSA